MPFDHIVVVMMANQFVDHYLGRLPVRGQPKADGFTFGNGKPIDSNPLNGKAKRVYELHDPCQPADSGSQSWNDTHTQINGGRMNGFAVTGSGSLGYYTDDTLPFLYGLAKTFTLANRWFSRRNYFADLPQTGFVPSVIKANPTNIAHVSEFFLDAALGNLPAVSFVDPEFGALDDVAGPISTSKDPTLAQFGGSFGRRAVTRKTRRTGRSVRRSSPEW